MYRKSFPKCEIKGDYKPVKFGHMVSDGAIPSKCATCSFLFEGECLRAIDQLGDYLRLDYESCKISGPTEPTEIENANDVSIFVPKKCKNCKFLMKSDIRGYFCNSEHEVWKDFPRDLDWGDWEPDYPLVGITRYNKSNYTCNYLGSAIVTKDLVLLLMKNETTKALKLYRKLNKIVTIKEAFDDIKILMEKLEKYYPNYTFKDNY